MNNRSQLKKQSRDKIVSAAAERMRLEGLSGSGIAAVMQDAGLTHGAFYAHFKNKDELMSAALENALEENRKRWVSAPKKERWTDRLSRLAKRYLTSAHRTELRNSCALASLGSEAARSEPSFKHSYEREFIKTLNAVCGSEVDVQDSQKTEDALAFMSLIIGSITLARAVESKDLSDQILAAGRNAASKLSSDAGENNHD